MELRRHAVIAGTGRSGTTFLIKYLSACGVPVGNFDQLPEYDDARAGKEQSLLSPEAPYLVKDPWLDEYIDQIDLSQLAIDALLVPVRDLHQSAMSRVRQERAALLKSDHPGVGWDSFGTTPGGIRYSLGVVDQERVLAVAQANLIEWALSNEIPLFMLHFPRMIEDEDYLPTALQPWLRRFCDESRAREVFHELTEPSTWYTSDIDIQGLGEEVLLPLIADLRSEIEALNLVLKRQRNELIERDSQQAADQESFAILQCEFESLRAHAASLEVSVAELTENRDSLKHQIEALHSSRSCRLGHALTAPLRIFSRSGK